MKRIDNVQTKVSKLFPPRNTDDQSTVEFNLPKDTPGDTQPRA